MALMEVAYVGVSDVREITPADVKPHGIKLDKKIVWDQSNGHKQVIDADKRFEDLLRAQGHFILVALLDSGEAGEVIATATDPERTETVVAKIGGKTQTSQAK